jgi:hypothetical protein
MSPFNDYLNKKNHYVFNSSWNIEAPPELIWDELINYKRWPIWCRGLEKIEALGKFDDLEKGNHIRSTWKGSLPYNICFDARIMDFDRCASLSFNVSGDLHGKGICNLLPSKQNTMVNFIWNVSPTKLWMKMSSPFTRPVFIENHDQIIDHAIKSFTQMVEQKGKNHNRTIKS